MLFSADLDIPPGFENTIYTAKNSSRGGVDHPRRGRGRGRRPYADRQGEGVRYDYRSRQRREINENKDVPPTLDPNRDVPPPLNPISDVSRSTSSAEGSIQQSSVVKRADGSSRGNGAARHHQQQRGRAYWRERRPKQRNDRDQNAQAQGNVE